MILCLRWAKAQVTERWEVEKKITIFPGLYDCLRIMEALCKDREGVWGILLMSLLSVSDERPQNDNPLLILKKRQVLESVSSAQ